MKKMKIDNKRHSGLPRVSDSGVTNVPQNDDCCKVFIKLLSAFFPVLFWMTIIFYFSSRESIGVTETFIFDFIIFKALHIGEYAILYFLLYRVFYVLKKGMVNNIYVIYAFLIALIYAVTDELHQTFVPTREGRLRDVFIDMIGIGGMLLIIQRIKQVKMNKIRNSKHEIRNKHE